jgi:two-component system, NarL family, nitrate/nitrite response regulator NarL
MSESVPKALTIREAEVARHVAEGCRNREIAVLLGITERTVKKHVANARRKLGATNRVALALTIERARASTVIIPPSK